MLWVDYWMIKTYPQARVNHSANRGSEGISHRRQGALLTCNPAGGPTPNVVLAKRFVGKVTRR